MSRSLAFLPRCSLSLLASTPAPAFPSKFSPMDCHASFIIDDLGKIITDDFGKVGEDHRISYQIISDAHAHAHCKCFDGGGKCAC